MKKKILHVVEAFGGGVFGVIKDMANLMADDAEVVIAYNVRSETPANFEALFNPKVKFIRIDSMQRSISPIKDFKGLVALCSLFKLQNPDVIHLHSSKAGFLGRIAAKLVFSNAKVFYSPHAFSFTDSSQFSSKKRTLFKLLETIGAFFGGTITACSSDELEIAKTLSGNAVLLKNAIDIKWLDSVYSEAPLVEHPLTIGVIARVCKQKRPELFFEISEQVKKRGFTNVHFKWIGGGDDKSHPNVSITGWMPREEALKQLKSTIDIYMLTSSMEGLPIATLEAMAAGLPIVASKVPGNSDTVERGVNGYLCSTVDEFTNVLTKLIEDSERRSRMGGASRERVETSFTLDRLKEDLVKLYF